MHTSNQALPGDYFKVLICEFADYAQHESCELSFIWGNMRAIAWETVFQTALRNCSEEVAGEVSIYVILVKGKYMQSSTYFCRLFLLVL